MTGALEPGVMMTLQPGIRRLIAPNPGLMTGPGTNSYILGIDEIAVVDPGPAIATHIGQIIADSGGPIRQILVTHTHPDHSPAAMRLAAETGARLLGIAAPQGPHQDASFVPDRTLADGDVLEVDGERLRVLHTPGHASNHLCYLHETHRWLFTGDHIINGSTVVIDPPDGNMRHYLDSLARLRNEQIDCIAPGHGAVIDTPDEAIGWLIEHRLNREAKVVHALDAHPDNTLSRLVVHVYAEVDPAIHDLAERSLLAHLEKLEDEGRAVRVAERWRPASA